MGSNVVATPLTAEGAVNAGVPESTLYGWSVKFSTSSNTQYLLVRVGDASGAIIAAINAANTTTDTKWFGPQGIKVPGLIFIDFVSTVAINALTVYHS